MSAQNRMTIEQALALPVSVELWPSAARAFGLGRANAYELAKRGEFPVPVLRLGGRYRVNRADILRALGIAERDAEARPA